MYIVRSLAGALGTLLMLPIMFALVGILLEQRPSSDQTPVLGGFVLFLWVFASGATKMNMSSATIGAGLSPFGSRVLAAVAFLAWLLMMGYIQFVFRSVSKAPEATDFQLFATALWFYGWPLVDFLELTWLARYSHSASEAGLFRPIEP